MALAALHPDLKGIERAAVLLMYLRRPIARDLLERLSATELREIGLAMANVDGVEPDLIEGIVGEFVKDLFRMSMLPQPGRRFALKILPGLVDDERRDRVEGALRRRLSTEFEEYIAGKPPQAVTAILQDEHPQTRAVALMLMGTANASKVVGMMDQEQQAEAAMRMASLKSIPGELADDVEEALRTALEEDLDRWKVRGVDTAAQILGRLGKERHDPILHKVAAQDRDLSDQLRRRMVLFSDLARLDRRAVQQVLREIEKQDLLLALAGATPDMQDFFLANLSKRAAQDLRDELEILGPTPKVTILQAQESIVIAAMQLAEDGMIYLPFGDDEEDDDGLM